MLAAARDAFATTVERYAQLVERVPETSIPIPDSEWTVRDATIHVCGSVQRMATLAAGEASTVPSLDKDFIAARARKLIDEDPETDGGKLADRIREGLARLLGVTATLTGDHPISYHAGLRLDLAQLFCLYLGEYLLHGYDIAVAIGAAWPIDPDDADPAIAGFRACYPAIFNPAAAAGLDATFQLDTAGTNPFFVRITDSACDMPTTPERVDCIISADPVTALFVLSGRMSQGAAAALGRLAYSGAHADLGPRFADLFVFP